MRVVHVTPWRLPRSMGGTEMFVDGLIRGQIQAGIPCVLASPATGLTSAAEEFAGLNILDLPATALSAEAPTDAPELISIRNALKLGPGTVWHQHGWTPSLWLPHLRAAKAAGCKTVVTVHLAGDLCLRGSMMRFGETPCSGLVETRRCGPCWAQGKGAPRAVAELLAL